MNIQRIKLLTFRPEAAAKLHSLSSQHLHTSNTRKTLLRNTRSQRPPFPCSKLHSILRSPAASSCCFPEAKSANESALPPKHKQHSLHPYHADAFKSVNRGAEIQRKLRPRRERVDGGHARQSLQHVEERYRQAAAGEYGGEQGRWSEIF